MFVLPFGQSCFFQEQILIDTQTTHKHRIKLFRLFDMLELLKKVRLYELSKASRGEISVTRPMMRFHITFLQ